VAQREMFLHGESELEAFHVKVKERVGELGWAVYWYTFDELLDRYRSGEQFMSW
jgi:hypothetical protein